jgi:hypothetical protein
MCFTEKASLNRLQKTSLACVIQYACNNTVKISFGYNLTRVCSEQSSIRLAVSTGKGKTAEGSLRLMSVQNSFSQITFSLKILGVRAYESVYNTGIKMC